MLSRTVEPRSARAPAAGGFATTLSFGRPVGKRAGPGLEVRDEPEAVEPRDRGTLTLPDAVGHRDDGRVLVVALAVVAREEPGGDQATDDEDQKEQQPGPEQRPPRRRGWWRRRREALLLLDDDGLAFWIH